MLFLVAAIALAASLANAQECGNPRVQPQLIDLNVLGGQEVVPHSFPWQAGLYTKPSWFNRHGSHFCAGSLIDNQTVVTAAHCLSMAPSRVRIHLGSHKRASRDKGEIFVNVKSFCRNPEYSGNVNDIGIIRLVKAVEFTETISPICLPEPNDAVRYNDKLYVTGWGYTSKDQRTAEVLMQAPQVQISKKRCQSMVPIETETLICTIHTRGSSCHGDSGGPLQTKRGDHWQLQGVVSGGPPVCGTPNYPMFYTETSKFVKWINAYKGSPSPTSNPSICG